MKSLINVLVRDLNDREFVLDIYSDGSAGCWSLDRSHFLYKLPLMILRTEKGYCVRSCAYLRSDVVLGDIVFECKKKHEANDFVIAFASKYLSTCH